MSSITFTVWLASVTVLLSWTGAAFAAFLSWRRYRLSSAARLTAQLSDLAETVERQSLELRNLRSRLNMRELRARRAAEPPESTAPIENGHDEDAAAAAVRAELNDALARGARRVNP